MVARPRLEALMEEVERLEQARAEADANLGQLLDMDQEVEGLRRLYEELGETPDEATLRAAVEAHFSRWAKPVPPRSGPVRMLADAALGDRGARKRLALSAGVLALALAGLVAVSVHAARVRATDRTLHAEVALHRKVDRTGWPAALIAQHQKGLGTLERAIEHSDTRDEATAAAAELNQILREVGAWHAAKTEWDTLGPRLRQHARSPDAQAAVQAGAEDIEAQLAAGEGSAALAALTSLRQLDRRIADRVLLRIVGGAWRYPNDGGRDRRNHYLVVEAQGERERRIEFPIRNEETGATTRTWYWAERVPAAVYAQVRRDKADNGLIDQDVFAEKPAGTLAFQTKPGFEAIGGRITCWTKGTHAQSSCPDGGD